MRYSAELNQPADPAASLSDQPETASTVAEQPRGSDDDDNVGPKEQNHSVKESKDQSPRPIRRSSGGVTDQVAAHAQGVPRGDVLASQAANDHVGSPRSSVVDAPQSSPQILPGRRPNASFAYVWNNGANGGAHGGAAARPNVNGQQARAPSNRKCCQWWRTCCPSCGEDCDCLD
jgi:hypothetical protein